MKPSIHEKKDHGVFMTLGEHLCGMHEKHKLGEFPVKRPYYPVTDPKFMSPYNEFYVWERKPIHTDYFISFQYCDRRVSFLRFEPKDPDCKLLLDTGRKDEIPKDARWIPVYNWQRDHSPVNRKIEKRTAFKDGSVHFFCIHHYPDLVADFLALLDAEETEIYLEVIRGSKSLRELNEVFDKP